MGNYLFTTSRTRGGKEMTSISYPDWINEEFPRAKGLFEHFKKHVITEIEAYDPKTKRGEYRWGEPGSCFHEMYIIIRPNAIITYGDLGTWVFRQGGIDLPWLRKAIDSPDYLFSKIVREHKQQYDDDETKKWAQERINELLQDPPRNIEEIQEEFKKVSWDDEHCAHEFFNEVLKHNPAYESLQYTWKAAGVTWPWVALKYFICKLDDTSNFHCDTCQKFVNKTIVGKNDVNGGYYCDEHNPESKED